MQDVRRPRRVAEVVDAESALHATSRLDYRIPGSLLRRAAGGYLWSADMGVKLNAVPPSGVVVSVAEYSTSRCKLELLKAKASGLNFIDGGFLYEGVRLCQSEPDATGDCWR